MQQILWEGNTDYGHYQVVDTPYDGRPARVLYSGDRQAAQSGVAQDKNPDLLFDYNQRLLELASNLEPQRLLIIGGGAFTLPAALLRALPDTSIDVVEIDPGLTDIAVNFFDLPTSERLNIFNMDGRTYLRSHTARYDMIIIDAFIHTAIPQDLRTIQAFEAYANHLDSDGVLAMNVISGYHGTNAYVLRELCAAAVRSFGTVDIFLASRGYSLWLPQNFVFTAQKGETKSLRNFVRYEAVAPPEFEPGMAIED